MGTASLHIRRLVGTDRMTEAVRVDGFKVRN